jgi:NADPH:quinone reductase-like Zn-dependent oxidoreductase
MKAAIFEKQGLDNLKIIDDAENPKIGDYDVIIKVKVAGINPIDYIDLLHSRRVSKFYKLRMVNNKIYNCYR